MKVTVEEAKTILPELCELAHAGLDVTIVKDGKPYMRLLPCAKADSADEKSPPSRAELRDSLPPGTFKLLPGWDEPLSSILEAETDKSEA